MYDPEDPGSATLEAVRGRAREVHPLLWLIAAAFAASFVLPWIDRLLG